VEGVIACDLYGKGPSGSEFPGRDMGIRQMLLRSTMARELDEPKESQVRQSNLQDLYSIVRVILFELFTLKSGK